MWSWSSLGRRREEEEEVATVGEGHHALHAEAGGAPVGEEVPSAAHRWRLHCHRCLQTSSTV